MITLTWWQLLFTIFICNLLGIYGAIPLARKTYEQWKKGVIKNRRRKINTRKYW